MQIWTLKGDKAYIFAYQASPNDYPKGAGDFSKDSQFYTAQIVIVFPTW